MAYSRDCPRWTFEKQVQSIKVSQHLSYPEASKLIKGPTPNKSFADIIKQSAKPQTKNISIQTDLHWPKNSASPIKIVSQKPTSISTQTSSSQNSSSQTSESKIPKPHTSTTKPSQPLVPPKQPLVPPKQPLVPPKKPVVTTNKPVVTTNKPVLPTNKQNLPKAAPNKSDSKDRNPPKATQKNRHTDREKKSAKDPIKEQLQNRQLSDMDVDFEEEIVMLRKQHDKEINK